MSRREKPYRRKTGILKTPLWGKVGPYYPDRVMDGGTDAPITGRGRLLWRVVLLAVVVTGVVLVMLSR